MMRWPICAGSPLTEMRPAISTLPFRAANQCLPQQAPCAVWAHRPPRLAHFSVTCPVSLCARRIVHTVCALAQVTISLKNALSEAFEAGTGVCGARLLMMYRRIGRQSLGIGFLCLQCMTAGNEAARTAP